MLPFGYHGGPQTDITGRVHPMQSGIPGSADYGEDEYPSSAQGRLGGPKGKDSGPSVRFDNAESERIQSGTTTSRGSSPANSSPGSSRLSSPTSAAEMITSSSVTADRRARGSSQNKNLHSQSRNLLKRDIRRTGIGAPPVVLGGQSKEEILAQIRANMAAQAGLMGGVGGRNPSGGNQSGRSQNRGDQSGKKGGGAGRSGVEEEGSTYPDQ